MRAPLRSLIAFGLVVGACTLGARDDSELSGDYGKTGTGGSGATDGGGGAGNCSAGTKDCDGLAANGCEVTLDKDPKNCGACANVCPSTDGKAATCVAGKCGISSCTAPQADCDGDGTCETDTSSSLDHCDFCNNKCALANAKPVCANGCQIEECSAGFESCDGVPSNGCETPLNTATDCGFCGTACTLANATSSCATGTCALTACSGGYADCDKLPDTGCESNGQTDPNNCGACGTKCTTGQVCQAGKCVVSSCTAPTANCDNNPGDCETNTSTSLAHCGFCNNPCTLAHATAACTAGKCTVLACSTGWGNCDANDANGCETQLNTATNCKSCGDQCSGGANIVTATCGAQGCNVTCVAGYTNCNGVAADGCEVQLATDPLHCGTCTKNCSVGAPPGTQPSCSGGNCTYNCSSGTADCDGNGSCETNLSTSSTNCGECGRSCSPTACVSGFCTPEVMVNQPGITSFDEDNTSPSLVFGRNPGGVFRVSKSTKVISTITTAQNSGWLDALATSVYFADPVAGVFRAPIGGGTPTQIGNALGVVQVDAYAGNVWLTTSSAALRVADTGGGPVDTFDPTPGGFGLRMNGQYAFWSVPAAGEIRYTEPNVPNVQKLATGQGDPAYVTTELGSVWWSASTDGAIRRAPIPPNPPTITTVVSNQPGVYAIATDGADLYWGLKGTGGIWRVALPSGPPVKLVDSVTGVNCLLVDATHLYWSDSTGLKRVPR